MLLSLDLVLFLISDQAPGDLDRNTKITANAKLCNDAVNDFQMLVQCDTEESFRAAWVLQVEKYSQYREWVRYLESEWLPKHRQWVRAWRKVRLLRLLIDVSDCFG